jgi:hypothetical protein
VTFIAIAAKSLIAARGSSSAIGRSEEEHADRDGTLG